MSNRKTITIHLPAMHTGQLYVYQTRSRFNTVCCGRRWGKTKMGEILLVEAALRGQPVAWMAPTYKMLTEVWRDLKVILQGAISTTNEQQHRLDLCIPNGVVEMWSLDNAASIRGRKYRRVIIDEAAVVRHLQAHWQEVIRPTLTDFRGDAWLFSTPMGRNFFWEMYQRGQDKHQPEYRSWQMPTATNPAIHRHEIHAMRAELPERVFVQEILAHFVETSGGVFRNIQACISREKHHTNSHATYVMGCDFARQEDFSVFTVMDAMTRAVIEIDRMNHIDYYTQIERLKYMAGRYNPTIILCESNSIGLPIIEQLERDGLPVQSFTTTNATKMRIIDALALAFEQEQIIIPDDGQLMGELLSFEMQRLPGGGIRYAAPAGQHDDMVMSLALAYAACAEGSRSLILFEV